ncbi:MAG: hypothetical protein A3H98_02800 [Bacteroidetes bacterium RIFCSPLOWO2_02_FULL_36_8]|nr:MAG: hypothetical protein A3H98_02800 [Bacteroidetes bacterium RIFCSPLOWO2_02_FULL_36_8]OFY72270.1 MAG: hypothetical protein A3G23_01415 [Bacteroidetes bacterium RIFCSPLOWO2_12_FULL_37_12]
MVTIFFTLQQTPAIAQCPMCRASLESNRASGGKEGNSINKGIIYLLVFPYLLIGSIGLYYFYEQKKNKKEATV